MLLDQGRRDLTLCGLKLSLSKLFYSFNIPRAKRELAQLNKCTSPQQKLICLRKVVQLITQSPSQRGLCSGKGPNGGVDAYVWMQKSVKEQFVLKDHTDGVMCRRASQLERPGVGSDAWVPSNSSEGVGQAP